MKRTFFSLLAYVSICLMGVVIGMAFGFGWGTNDAGVLSVITFGVASAVTISIATFPGEI